MKSVYDWVTVAIFAGLLVLFLQRSMAPEDAQEPDSIITYLIAGVGCAVANYLGNHEMHIAAVLLIVATLAFVVRFLKPFGGWPKS
jgi:hypothetical protein